MSIENRLDKKVNVNFWLNKTGIGSSAYKVLRVHLEVTVHVCGKFITGYYQVWCSYLHPDMQADVVIDSYNHMY